MSMEEIYVKKHTIKEKDGCRVIEELRYAGTVGPDGTIRLNGYVRKRMATNQQSVVSKDAHHKIAA